MFFRDIIGHESALIRLRTLARGRALGPAYLLHGPAGVGKHRAATAFAAALLCDRRGDEACGECAACERLARENQPDLLIPEIEGEKDIVKMKYLREEFLPALAILPARGQVRVCLIDEAERCLPDESQNALLKTLEEQPKNTVFLLVAAHPERLLPTIVSRCQSIRFGPLPPEEVARVLKAQKVPAAEAGLLAALADGRPGEALRLREGGSLERRRAFLEPFADRGATAPWIDAAVTAGKGGSGSLEGARGRAKELLGFLAEPLRLALRAACGAPASDTADPLSLKAAERCARLGDAERLAGLLEGLMVAQRALDENANSALWIENALIPFLEAQDAPVSRVKAGR
ncbi:MAG: AAA family ATPase [Planctomycetes bacterium]|nr:AAA family ATPase [Planctomycetota bacterium]